MTSRLPRILSFVAVAATLLAAGWVLSGQPARDRIIESATVSTEAGHAVINVKLSFPFRYLSHFPQTQGREVRIRIAPVRVSSPDLGAVFKNEGLTPPHAALAALDEVLYEGDAAGGPQLTIRFDHPVQYEVILGSDYRSVNVVVDDVLNGHRDANKP
jgi:hypothetical protein